MNKIISDNAISTRRYWIEQIRKLSGNFGDDTDKLELELGDEIKKNGISSLIDHLRLCGNIPESYGHDTSEEKLYSKYTDYLLSLAFSALGLKSIVLKERGDTADVEAFAKDYSFVADAKAFRLSRTAKNQKDFKIQAMHVWKRGKPYAMVVCPIYQLPASSSQIYQQAITQNVCIFTYSHLSLLLSYSEKESKAKVKSLLKLIFETVKALNSGSDGIDYWLTVNKSILAFSEIIEPLWIIEKIASNEVVNVENEIHQTLLAKNREQAMRHQFN